MFGFFKKVDKKETLPVEKELLYSQQMVLWFQFRMLQIRSFPKK